MAVGGNLFTFLSLGEIFSRTFSIFVDRLDIYLTISGLVHLPAIALTVLVVLALAPDMIKESDSHVDFISNHMAGIFTVLYTQMVVTM